MENGVREFFSISFSTPSLFPEHLVRLGGKSFQVSADSIVSGASAFQTDTQTTLSLEECVEIVSDLLRPASVETVSSSCALPKAREHVHSSL